MQLNEYQRLAARTINAELNDNLKAMHALHGMSSEIGEIHGLYQKVYKAKDVEPSVWAGYSRRDIPLYRGGLCKTFKGLKASLALP
jgi:hypothetical protein